MSLMFFLTRLSRKLERRMLQGKLSNMSWRVSTTFSGALMPEIAVKSLCKAILNWSGEHCADHRVGTLRRH